MSLFQIENLRCSYDKKYCEGTSRVVLEIQHLCVPRGRKIFIVGESGIGKSTILETLGMMNNTLVPNQSTRFVFTKQDGTEVDLKLLWSQSDRERSLFRLYNYSFIFQSTNLMRNFTAYENIAFTRMLQGYSRQSCFDKTGQVLRDLGLDHVDQFRMTQELSGGQQQRLAFARAILPDFTVLFGDEPTGNLDAENAVRVMNILSQKLDEQEDASAIIVSHDMHLATCFADIIIKIRKCIRSKKNDAEEDVLYGVIDDDCIFQPIDAERKVWGNGKTQYGVDTFEDFLRKK